MIQIRPFVNRAVLAELDGGMPLELHPEQPTVYVSRRDFDDHGRHRRRFGLIADACCKADGAALFLAENGSLDHLLAHALQDGQARTELEYVDGGGHLHQLWAVDEPGHVEAFLNLLRGRELLDTRLRPVVEAEARPLFLLNLNDYGLVCRCRCFAMTPCEGFDSDELLYQLHASDFNVININQGAYKASRDALFAAMADEDSNDSAIGLALPRRLFLLRLPKNAPILSEISPDQPPEARSLDVNIAAAFLFRHLLHAAPGDGRLERPVSREEALAGVEDGSFQLAALVKPPTLEELHSLIAAGMALPERSIYLYPPLPRSLRRAPLINQ